MTRSPDEMIENRILVVDDDEHIRVLIRDTLSQEFDLDIYSTGEEGIEALTKALEAGGQYCMAILDINLPGMDGLTVARRLRVLDPQIYIILISGGVSADLESFRGELERNLLLIRKPFSLTELILASRYFSNTWVKDRQLEKRTQEAKESSVQREQSQALNSAIVKTALDCIITINSKGEIIEWNPAAEQTFGYTREEILGSTMSETIVPQHMRQAHENGMNRYLDTQVSHILGQRIEISALHRDGHEFPVELAITPLMLDDEQIFTAYLRDISAQREAEAQMKLQSQTLEAAANGIIITDEKGSIVWCNPSFLSLTGYEAEEVIGKSTRMLRSGKHDKAFYEKMWSTIQKGDVWQSELLNRRKDGSLYTEDMTITPVTNPDGEISNYIAIKQDVTERIAVNRQLEESERKYRSIFESIQDVYAEIEYPPGIIREVSPSIEEMSGYTRDELLGKPFDDFVAAPGVPPELMQQLLERGRVNDFEVTLLDKSGAHRPVSFTVSYVQNENDEGGRVVGTMRDIAVRKQAELALQQSVKIKTNFVSNVSHELRTPMASILGFAGTILRDDKMPSETQNEFIRIIYEEAQRLTRLIENVLDISRMEAGTTKFSMNAMSLEPLVSEVAETQKVLAQDKGVTLNCSCARELPPIIGAGDALNQMLVNLVSNAIKFTDPGGEVHLSVTHNDKHVLIEVRDSGIGIPELEAEKIFEKFYRVDNEQREDEGTGIGLAIVREIVEQHKGAISVDSAPGKGSTFKVRLPVLDN